MLIELKKFGTTLSSRQIGKESFSAFQNVLNDVTENETVVVDFDGVNTFSPSWGDEFLTPLYNKYGQRLLLKKTSNPSVNATVEVLEETNNIKFKIKTSPPNNILLQI